jgi:hypothetical protein
VSVVYVVSGSYTSMRAHLSKAELLAARYDLRRAGIALGRVRGVFISAGAARGAAAINMMIDKLAHLIARIDKALMAKP